MGGLDHCCLVVERADPGIKSESSLVEFSSNVTVKKRRENILPAIKVLTFEKLDVNHFRGQRVNFQVGLIAKKITGRNPLVLWQAGLFLTCEKTITNPKQILLS